MLKVMNETSKKLFEFNQFTELTSVQSHVIKELKNNRDLIVKSDTGTGKTHAFLFAICQMIDPTISQTQAIIIAPTRELAMQINDFARDITKINEAITVDIAIGGMDNSRLKKKLEGQPSILISTPGKLLDILSWNVIRLDYIKAFVIDETDMMLDYGFIGEVDSISSRIPNNAKFMLFSATIPQGLKAFIKKYLKNPIEINSEEKRFKPRIEHILINQRHRKMDETVLDILSAINPLLCVIFVNTKLEAASLSSYLREYGVDTVEIHGDVSDRGRKQVLAKIHSGNARYIVATDLAARGIDLPEISHIINAGLPVHDLDFYTHRAGRTGRSGRDGYAISIVAQRDQTVIQKLMRRGYTFTYKKVLNGALVDTRAWYHLEKRQKPVDPEVAQILNRKNVKVKPGYKVKRKREIDSLMRKKHRQLVQDEIRQQKKERAKERQRKKQEIV